MRTKCQWIATFHRLIHSHWSLPLICTLKGKEHNLRNIHFKASKKMFVVIHSTVNYGAHQETIFQAQV